MSKYSQQTLGRIRTAFVCGLTYVLMAGILYSATFGVVHNHVNALIGPNAGISNSSTRQAAVSTTTLTRASDINECLTCVLHRQFSSTTIHSPIFVIGPIIEVAFSSKPAVFYSSDVIHTRPLTSLSGRAPPFPLV